MEEYEMQESFLHVALEHIVNNEKAEDFCEKH